MKKPHISMTSLAIAVALAGCAEIQQRTGMDDKTASTAGGAVVGCAIGAVLAKVSGGNAAGACVAGAAIGGLAGFEKARQDEITAANTAREEAAAALKALPPQQAKAVRIGEVKTVQASVADKGTKQEKKYTAFDSVTVDMPVSAKGTPEYDAAMGKLKALAERVADERGAAEIIVSLPAAEARTKKVVAESNSVKSSSGKGTITVTKRTDTTIPKGIQRITVKAGALAAEA